MIRSQDDVGGSCVVVESGIPEPTDLTIVERKGWGHPDTLADHLAERLSREYSTYTMEHFGGVLHHNFDKLALLGGRSEVRYGSGRMLQPVRVLVNGRATGICGGELIPVDEMVVAATKAFFHERLPMLDANLRIELNITNNPSPGAVVTDGGVAPERSSWFAPRSLEDLRERRVLLANDTSLGTGWAPESPYETFIRDLVDHLSGPNGFRQDHPWCGSDVKLMGYAARDVLDIVLCVPQLSAHVADLGQYLANKQRILAECRRWASSRWPQLEARFRLNVRDVPDRDELYLTHTGSSIESGDEGVVGRGNRVNGLITPLRPMNVEGANGKNPVYHVGKLYNLAARQIAQRLHEATGGYAEVHLVSATGLRLARPWRILVRLTAAEVLAEKVHAEVFDVLDDFPALTRRILTTDLVLS
ncbi:S-adenosylmethionine synthetase [Actinocatenispora thailandica]|uniref:S-adenosylmethionine synthetase n=1 Tax=Actinocatenispora thailandica TaxID=227318 RepID=A0A7R7DRN9_9ACTN|nr:methionine adenosyltransferase [Actinocatenispora thailandica]BCJ36365.1 S-adenosylmethionine synthetase [Actinocatenispora thailandica]